MHNEPSTGVTIVHVCQVKSVTSHPILNFFTVRETVKKLLVGLLSNNSFEKLKT